MADAFAARVRPSRLGSIRPAVRCSGVIRSFLDNGGQVWACGACTKPRGITEADLIAGAKIVTAANVVEEVVGGAAVLSV